MEYRFAIASICYSDFHISLRWCNSCFYFGKNKEKKEETLRKLAAGNSAIFLLGQKFNVLHNIKKQLIEPVRNDPGAWINLRSTLNRNHNDLRFDVESLQYLLYSENPSLLHELLIEDQRFFEAIKTLNKRSFIHNNQLQPRLEQIDYYEGVFVYSSEIEAALGYTLVGQMKTLTQALMEHTYEGLEGIKNMHDKLFEQIKKMFPDGKIIKLNFPED